MHSIATSNGMAVLMARIVDHAGVGICPEMVHAISYALYELTSEGPAVVVGHDLVPLDVDDVMFDSLQTGGLWNLDVSGYNFRHEVDFVPAKQNSRSGTHYALVYEFVAMSGEKSIIHFRIRGHLP